jgi:hypothetical protein
MFEKAASRMLSPINTAAVSILGLFNMLLGVWILLPFDAFNASVPEFFYGLALFVIGLSIVYGSAKEIYKILAIGTRLSYYLWFLTMLASLYVDWHDPYWIISLMIACYGLFVATNIKVNKNNLPFKNL